MKFEVTYSRVHTWMIDAYTLEEAARRMYAFCGGFKEGEIKLLSIIDPTKKPGIEDAVLRGQHKNGIEGITT